jgi:2-desacetyl-2-hydroxyethyl bacteriochlorophyllide A dehydrogenase
MATPPLPDPVLPNQARALWITGVGQAELRAEPIARPSAHEVLVQTLYSGVSRGTERLVYGGRVPESERVRMRAPFQLGEFPFPVKYGYANVGRVIAGSEALCGQHVFCLYPHQEAYVVTTASVHRLPSALPPARAVLAANMETALNGVWDSELCAGDRVCVVGAGVVGCLVAYLAAQHPGCEVALVDSDERKRAVASALGVTFAAPSALPTGCDVVFHASGAPSGLRSALEAAGHEARIVELSWYGDAEVTLPLGAAFHAQRLTLRSSQVGRLPSAQLPRWDTRRRMALALALLCDPRLDALISGESPFEQAPAVLSALARPEHFELCHRLRYEAR